MGTLANSENTKQTRNKRGTNPNSLANLTTGGGGRPKQPKEFKELVKANTIDALKTVIEIMNNPDAKATDRLKASELIIDRAYGKATQVIDADLKAQVVNSYVAEWGNENQTNGSASGAENT